MKKIIILFALVTMTGSISAQNSDACSGTLLFDEDFFWELLDPSRNLDKDYTGGAAFSFTGRFVDKFHLTMPNILMDRLLHVNNIHKKFIGSHSSAIRFGVTMFTPEGKYLNIFEPVRTQRPYASLVFVGTSRTTVSADDKTSLTTGLDIGALGFSWGGSIQAYIHKIYRKSNNLCDECQPYEPKGWHNQISSGGEPTFLYSIAYKKRLTGPSEFNSDTYPFKIFDASYSVNGSMGYHNAIGGSITARVGIIRSAWWAFNSYPMGQTTQEQKKEQENKKQENKREKCIRNFEFYLFASARPSIMIYSTSLQGQFRNSVYKLNSGEVNHLLFQTEAGLTLSFLRIFSLSAVLTYRTKQYKLDAAKDHSWFGTYLTIRQPFNK